MRVRGKGGYQSRNISISIDPFREVIIPFFAALRRKRRRRQVFRCPSYLSSLWNKDTAGAEWFPWLISTFLSFGSLFFRNTQSRIEIYPYFRFVNNEFILGCIKKNCFYSNRSVCIIFCGRWIYFGGFIMNVILINCVEMFYYFLNGDLFMFKIIRFHYKKIYYDNLL